MSLGACIPGMVKNGELTEAQGAEMKRIFEMYQRHYRPSMSAEAAAAEASKRTLGEMAADLALKKRQTFQNIQAQQRGLADMALYRGESDWAAIQGMLTNDPSAPYENADLRRQEIEFDQTGYIRNMIERHRRNFMGSARDKAGLDDMTDEMHGDVTGNPRAAAFAEAASQVIENLRLMYNAAGGAIGKLERYFPHRWSTAKVRALGELPGGGYDVEVGYERYRDEIMLPNLDTTRMRDPLTGGDLTAERLDEVLRASYDNTRSGGLMGEASAQFTGAGMLANRRTNSERFLHFKDGASWRRAHAAIGEGDAFSILMDHISGMARDIALMERFGPNPDATMRLLLDHASRREGAGGTARSAVAVGMSGGKAATENLFAYIKGESNIPIIPEKGVAGWMQGPPAVVTRALAGTRNLLTSAWLGMVPIGALSDIATQRTIRKFNGLPEARMVMSYIEQLNPLSAADRRRAINLGLGSRDATRSLLGLGRYYGDLDHAGWTSVVADDVLRLTLNNKVTEAGQRGFGDDFLRTLGQARGKTLAQLPEQLQAALDRYGIDAKTWDTIRAAEPLNDGGVDYVMARNIADARARGRLMQMVLGETQAAVTETTPNVRAAMAAVGRPGTWGRESLANTLQWKGFTLSLMQLHAQRMATIPFWNAAKYGAGLFIGMTVAGAVQLQIREFLKGRDFRPMAGENPLIPDGDFMFDSMTQGGGAGIVGDLVGTFRNDRLGESGLAEFMGGPFGTAVGDVSRAWGTAVPHQLKDGSWSTANPGKAAIRLASRYTPGSNLWYTRAAFQHFVLDSLSEAVDPTYLESQQRMQQWAADNHQGMWWQPGAHLPDRAPNVSNAAGPQYALPPGE